MRKSAAEQKDRLFQLHKEISDAVLLLLDKASEAGRLLLDDQLSPPPREGLRWYMNHDAGGLRWLAKTYMTIYENYEKLKKRPESLLSGEFILLASVGLDDDAWKRDLLSIKQTPAALSLEWEELEGNIRAIEEGEVYYNKREYINLIRAADELLTFFHQIDEWAKLRKEKVINELEKQEKRFGYKVVT